MPPSRIAQRDGKLDGDIRTLHKDNKPSHSMQRRADEQEWLRKMTKRVTIPKRKFFLYSRDDKSEELRTYAQSYSVVEADAMGVNAKTTASIEIEMLKMDLALRYKDILEHESLANATQDSSCLESKSEDDGNLVTAIQLQAIREIYEEIPHEEYDVEWLYTRRMGIPLRDKLGRMIRNPDFDSMFCVSFI